MTAELSTEEVVTRLLTSNEIIINNKKNLFISNPIIDTLGDILPVLEPENEEIIEDSAENTKYTFINFIPHC